MIFKKSDLLKKVNESCKCNVNSENFIKELVDTDLSIIGKDDEVDNPTDVTSNSTTDSHMDAATQQNGKNRTNAQFGALDIANTLIEDENIDKSAEIIRRKIYENFSI